METPEKYNNQLKEVAYFMRLLYKHGFTNTSGWNISLRVTDDIIVEIMKKKSPLTRSRIVEIEKLDQ